MTLSRDYAKGPGAHAAPAQPGDNVTHAIDGGDEERQGTKVDVHNEVSLTSISTDTPTAMPTSGVLRPIAQLGLILGLLVTAQFVLVLDFSIVQIALPTIRNELGISLADSQWIVSAYGLTFAGFLMLSGRASDLYGRKRLFTIGLVLFSLASLTGGLTTSELVLIAARATQGVGAALASATGLALMIRIFGPLGRLNQALGVFTAVSSAGFASGVILGGVLTQTLGWRWVFFVNVPIGLVASVLAIKFLPRSADAQKTRGHLDCREQYQ